MCESLPAGPGSYGRIPVRLMDCTMPISAKLGMARTGALTGTWEHGLHDTPHLCRYLTVQKSREIKMTKSAPTCRVSRQILTTTIGRQEGGLAQFSLRIQECENGWRQTNSTAEFRFCSILGRLCLFNAQSSKWQKNAWGHGCTSMTEISTQPVILQINCLLYINTCTLCIL